MIDTSAIIDLEGGKWNLREALGPLGDDQGVLPAVVWAELLVGVRLVGAIKELRARRFRRIIPHLIALGPISWFAFPFFAHPMRESVLETIRSLR